MWHAEPELVEGCGEDMDDLLLPELHVDDGCDDLFLLLADSGEPKNGDTWVKLGKLVLGDAISHRDFCDGFVTLVFLDLGGGADSSSDANDSSCIRYLLLGLKHKGVSFET